LEPPDPIPNSAVKRCIADGSVGFPHVRVGHRQDQIPKPPSVNADGGFVVLGAYVSSADRLSVSCIKRRCIPQIPKIYPTLAESLMSHACTEIERS
jgi:hypothetical protein